MKPKLVIVTGNKMKYDELSYELSKFFECEQKTFDVAEIQGTPEKIIQHKALEAYGFFKEPVLVDDVSLHLEELNGFPGPYIKDFLRCFTPYQVGVKFSNTRVRAVCWLGLCRGDGDILIVKGIVDGKVVTPVDQDHKDRYFDLFIQADGTDKPMIDFSTEEKNKFSHRGLAMENLLEILKKENK